MRWLIYRSRPTSVPWPSTILDIARAAERRNVQGAVSGMLVFAHDCYLQYLEGEGEAFDALCDSIRNDPRHAVVWWHEGESTQPRLAGLTLGYLDADRETHPASDSRLWRQRHDWQESSAQALVDMLVEIAREKYPSATGGLHGAQNGAG